MPMSPDEMVKFLKKNGFVEVRQGSTAHRVLKNPKTGRSTVVSMHGKELSKGMEHTILREAGLKKK